MLLTIFNHSYVKSTMQQNSNVRIITENINNKLDSMSNQSEYSLPGALSDVRFTDNEVSKSVGQVVDNVFDHDKYPITDSNLASTLKKKYYREAKDEGLQLTSNDKNEIDDLVSEFKRRISDNIEVPYLSHAVDFLSTMSMVVVAVDVILILIFIFVIIYLAHRFNSTYAMVHYVGISFMWSAFLTFIIVMIGYWFATSKDVVKAMGNFEVIADAFANTIFFDFMLAVLAIFAVGFIAWVVTPIKREQVISEIVDDSPEEREEEVRVHNYQENQEIEDAAIGRDKTDESREVEEKTTSTPKENTKGVEETTNKTDKHGEPEIKTFKKKEK